MVEQSCRAEQAVQLQAMAVEVLARQMHLAAQLPRNYIIDHTKCGTLGYPLQPFLTQGLGHSKYLCNAACEGFIMTTST